MHACCRPAGHVLLVPACAPYARSAAGSHPPSPSLLPAASSHAMSRSPRPQLDHPASPWRIRLGSSSRWPAVLHSPGLTNPLPHTPPPACPLAHARPRFIRLLAVSPPVASKHDRRECVSAPPIGASLLTFMHIYLGPTAPAVPPAFTTPPPRSTPPARALTTEQGAHLPLFRARRPDAARSQSSEPAPSLCLAP
ncbi:hypothetical protein FRC08_013281, partial [Ceratobasidium sp. 394]